MQIIIALIIAIALLFIIWFIVKTIAFKKHIVKNFEHSNTIVFGKKGTGKDLIFNKVINARKHAYYANIPYKKDGFLPVMTKDLSLMPNTYENFIDGKSVKVPRMFYEGLDIYLSDGGIILPSQYDAQLHKKYPSFPIYYALSRHLYNSNVHINSQNLERIWKALREQADFYVRTERTYNFGFFLVTKCYTYDNYESAKKALLPLGSRLFNKYSKAEADQFYATNGTIKRGFVFQLKKNIKYDTRYFEKLLQGERLEY